MLCIFRRPTPDDDIRYYYFFLSPVNEGVLRWKNTFKEHKFQPVGIERILHIYMYIYIFYEYVLRFSSEITQSKYFFLNPCTIKSCFLKHKTQNYFGYKTVVLSVKDIVYYIIIYILFNNVIHRGTRLMRGETALWR